MDFAVFDRDHKFLEGLFEDDDQVGAAGAAKQYPAEVGAWEAPVCPWHPRVAREDCPEYPHE